MTTIPRTAVAAPPRRGGAVGDFFTGVGFLVRGIGLYARSPRVMLLGLLPAIITFALLVGGFVAMFYRADNIVAWATPFADDWSETLRTGLRALFWLALMGLVVVLSLLLFTVLTILIGQPFYEAISKRVEDELGGVPGEINPSFWRTLPRIIWENVRLITVTVVVALFVLLFGLIPVVGQVLGPVLGALLGGWVLAVELTSPPFERRGLKLRDRRRMLRSRRAMALGFGMATFVCFLTGIGAVLLMPAAVAGSTLLSRRLLGPH